MSDEMVERVLRAVEQVPAGRVVAYGDVASLVGTSARRVGTIMSNWGGEVSWWRVTNAAGRMPEHLLPLARKQWQREGVPSDSYPQVEQGGDAQGCQLLAIFRPGTPPPTRTYPQRRRSV